MRLPRGEAINGTEDGMARPSLKSVVVVLLLVVTMVTQAATAGVVLMGGAGAVTGAVQQAGADEGDRFLADLIQSICSKDKDGAVNATMRDCLCQFCLPSVADLTSASHAQDVEIRDLAEPAAPWPDSLTLPPSRRLAGDGPSRAPPGVA